MQSDRIETLKSDLHEADIESLERRLAQMALEQTGARHGAIFLWDEDEQALVLDFHLVDTVVVTLPGGVVRRREDGRPGGIALWVAEHNQPYLCTDAARDPNYAPYFLEVGSIAAVPITYQHRAIGVITVSADAPGAFDRADIERLEALAEPAAMFLRRAQLYRKSRAAGGRPFLIKGLSPKWLEVERRLERVSPTHAPVLIHGESGTGKELVAHAIHFNSRRSEKPFITVNCAAIPETMLESVLFGHVKGAFTGATFDKIGEFQKADGGTLFLDEVGELPLALQAKVLRALDQGEVSPLGSNKAALRVDVRVICATHRDLPQMVEDGKFRQDLYFRLGVMTMELPALREYKDNLPVLASVFLQQAAQRHGTPETRLTPEAIAVLRAHDFPGNVRELRNAIEHAVIMAGGEPICAEHLPAAMGAPLARAPRVSVDAEPTLKELRERWLAPLERQYLGELLARCEGNVARAAEAAGVNTVTMYRLLKRRNLKIGRQVR